ncbi:MAG: lipocalin family protein [Flavobacterium sp.]
MKKQILLLTMIAILFSCNKNNADSNLKTGIIGNWKLTEMTGNIANAKPAKASEMPWQETYQFNDNSTFQKTRDRDGITTKASGTYKLTNDSNIISVELNFDNESEIIGSCSSKTKEYMSFQSEKLILSNDSWSACDGPGLKYEKTN